MDGVSAADHLGPIIFDAEVPPGQRIGLASGQEQAEIGDQRHRCAEGGIAPDLPQSGAELGEVFLRVGPCHRFIREAGIYGARVQDEGANAGLCTLSRQ